MPSMNHNNTIFGRLFGLSLSASGMKLIFTIAAISAFSAAAGKGKDSTNLKTLIQAEQYLKNVVPDFVGADSNDRRQAAAWELYRAFDTLLQLPESFRYPWDSLKTRTVSILASPDNKVRLYTWNLVETNGNFRNFGYLQVRRRNQVEVYPLLDTAKKFNADMLDAELETTEWLGALYYSITPFKQRGKTHYLLLGFDGSTIHSNKAVMDVLSLTREGPRFGTPAFRQSDADPSAECRVVFEFHNEVKMLLRYEVSQKIVVADKLTPAFPEAAGDYYYYIPSGDYDVYSLSGKGTWIRSELKDWNMGQGEKPTGPNKKPVPEE